MSDSQNMSDEVRARLRAIPSVNELLAEWPVVKATGETCDAVVHAAVTAELDEERAAIRAGAAPRSKRDLASAIEWRAHRSALPSLRPAVNATGVVIHTNLGRAPLAESASQGASSSRCVTSSTMITMSAQPTMSKGVMGVSSQSVENAVAATGSILPTSPARMGPASFTPCKNNR